MGAGAAGLAGAAEEEEPFGLKGGGAEEVAGEGLEGVDEAEGVGFELSGHAVEADVVDQGEQGAGVVGVDEEGLVEVEDEAVGVGDGDLVEVVVVAVDPGAPEEEVQSS